jgi:hypothetical protein
LLSPAVGYTNGPKIYLPEPDDDSPQAALKRDLIRRASTILDAGKAKLQGQRVRLLPGVKEDDFDRLEEVLEEDPEQREFFELLHVAISAQLLIEPELAV